MVKNPKINTIFIKDIFLKKNKKVFKKKSGFLTTFVLQIQRGIRMKRKRGRPSAIENDDVKTKIFSVRMSERRYNELKNMCTKKGWSMANVISQAVHEYYVRSNNEYIRRREKDGLFIFDNQTGSGDD